MATQRTLFGSCFVHVVEVFIESTVSSDEVSCSSVIFPVGYKRSVEVVNNFSVITSQDHLVCLGQSLVTM